MDERTGISVIATPFFLPSAGAPQNAKKDYLHKLHWREEEATHAT